MNGLQKELNIKGENMNALKIAGGMDYDEQPELILPVPKTAGSGPISHHWLNNLLPGTIFLVKKKNTRESMLMELAMQFKSKVSCRLINPENGTPMWVDPVEFSRTFDLFEIIATPDEVKELANMKEEEDGDSNTLQEGQVGATEVLPE